MFQHLVDIAVTNSFVIHKVQLASMQQRPLTRHAFQEELAAHLLGANPYLSRQALEWQRLRWPAGGDGGAKFATDALLGSVRAVMWVFACCQT